MSWSRALLETSSGWLPANHQDNAWSLSGETPNVLVTYLHPVTGAPLEPDAMKQFYTEMRCMREERVYTTTTHLPLWVRVGEVDYIYLYLDNNQRANTHGHPLHSRLCSLVSLVNGALRTVGDNAVLFLGQVRRPSYYGSVGQRTEQVYWLQMREKICRETGLVYIGEKASNENPTGLSYGIGAACTPGMVARITGYHGVTILNDGPGCAALGVCVDSQTVWCTSLPVDQVGAGRQNYGYRAMVNLFRTASKYPGSVVALGTLGIVNSKTSLVIEDALTCNGSALLGDDLPTYYAAHYEVVGGAVPPPL
jgi:hypothetical protein